MDGKIQEHKKIDSIQALRAWAFLGVFVSHTGIRCFKGMGAWGVSIFFILSGFLMTYNYYGKKRIESISFIKNMSFAWNKIKHFYPLHIITMLAMSIFMFIGEDVVQISQMIVKLFLNLLLLQCWIPIQSSINGVSWYLCVTMFLYFLFPYILKYMERDYSVYKAKRMFVLLVSVQIVMGIIGLHMPIFSYVESGWIEKDLTQWFVYYFPPTRALDFAIGCNMGYCFVVKESEKNQQKNTTFLELITIALIIVANICFVILCPKTGYGDKSLLSVSSERWWTYTIIFTISSCMVIWLFAKNEGGIYQKYLVTRMTLYIGNISSFSFLIHAVVFRYIDAVSNLAFGSEFRYFYGKWIKLSVGFILTIVATQIWLLLTHKKIKF